MRFERVDQTSRDWDAVLASLPGPRFCHRPEWLEFLQQSQRGEPVAAVLWDGGNIVGAFAGLVVTKFGVRILGSPFPGWTSPYMGLAVRDGVVLRDAVGALVPFAFRDLRCAHLELMDRHLTLNDLDGLRFRYRAFSSWEVDVHRNEAELIGSFSRACRTQIRRAIRNGLVVEEALDAQFVDDYYSQLSSVFARQQLVPTYPKDRVHQLIDAVRPTGQLLLLRVRTADGRPAATGIFHALDGQRIYAWGLASSPHLRDSHPNELLVFHALNWSRDRGFKTLDLAGSGDYKKKYHPRPILVPWVQMSKHPVISSLRTAALYAYSFRQHAVGRLLNARRSLP
jgi:hypothetical protein